ncbi:hypothetical protein ElyMa_005425400 [Elysia marginata]|uniref:Uncharacterized protein n=1 Tax=Elysia marginata TaxID=1093978 RepID=A0AAV4EJ09_9GAST|nr:hypothetical protein ElyMa_005425400 [Elysia marginata]
MDCHRENVILINSHITSRPSTFQDPLLLSKSPSFFLCQATPQSIYHLLPLFTAQRTPGIGFSYCCTVFGKSARKRCIPFINNSLLQLDCILNVVESSNSSSLVPSMFYCVHIWTARWPASDVHLLGQTVPCWVRRVWSCVIVLKYL